MSGDETGEAGDALAGDEARAGGAAQAGGAARTSAAARAGERALEAEGRAAAGRPEALLATRGLTVDYSGKRALHETSLAFEAGTVTALIGPSGCGKSTFLRSLNLMNREIPGCQIGGEVWFRGRQVNDPRTDVCELRRRVGMVFQQPNPFPMSIFENVAFGPRRHGTADKRELAGLVEQSLRAAALWDEVKDKLGSSGLSLSGGQQQRLCIARTLALRPDVVLMDEPCSALDPIATLAVEQTVSDMAARGICVVIVTHNMQQAARVSDRCAFFYLGELVESAPTKRLFSEPAEKRTADYLAGAFG